MLDAYHEKLVSDVKAIFGDSLTTVDAYFPEALASVQEAGIVIDTPAALIEIEQLNDSWEDDIDERGAVLCSVVIHCILSTKTENLQRELWNFSAELMRGMRKHGFGLVDSESGGKPEMIQSLPGRFDNSEAGYDSRSVVFEQVVFLGEKTWQPAPDIQRVFWSLAPEIGAAHQTKYEEVT